MNKLRHARAHLLWLLPALALASACSSSDDSDDGASDKDGAASTPDGGSSTDSGAGTTSDGSTGTGTPDGGTGGSGGGRTVVTSTCAPASVALGVEANTAVANMAQVDNLLVGYFDHDSKADVVAMTSESGSDTIQVFLGKGDGTFGAPQSIVQSYDTGQDAESSTVADVNGDGLDDLLVGGADTAQNQVIALFISKGDGTFQPAVYTMWAASNDNGLLQVLTGDFNADKHVDILYTSEQDGAGLILGTSAGGFAGPGTSLASLPSVDAWLAVADLNGDGASDIVSSVSANVNVPGPCVYLNNGSGTFPAMPTCSTLTSGLSGIDDVQIADVNKDGKLDIVGTYLGASGVTGTTNIDVFLGQGNGTFGTAVPYTLSADMRAVRIVDVNNDGYPDYVGYDQSNDAQLDVLLNDGAGKFAATSVNYALGAPGAFSVEALGVGDFAGNGLKGFVGTSFTSGTYGFDTIVATCKP